MSSTSTTGRLLSTSSSCSRRSARSSRAAELNEMTALPSRLADDWTDLLRLLGERALMLHTPDPRSELSGADYDCAVFNLDRLWPLRLTGGWSLCQCVHYDLLGWYWVLERDGDVFALDTVVDPEGLG